MKKSKLLSIYHIILLALFIVSFSISLPILIRQFYYLQIKPLKIMNYGYSYDQIKQAYDCMLNYCLGLTKVFSCGSLKFSESGMSHFTDCRGLFILDIIVLVFTSINLLVIKFKFKDYLYKYKHNNGFYGCIVLLVLFSIIGTFAIIDFDKMFELFHTVFFPGKENWLFDPRYDEIINILPQEFFRNCGILIISSIILLCTHFIGSDIRERKLENE